MQISNLNPEEEKTTVKCDCCGKYIKHTEASYLCGEYYCDEDCEPEELLTFLETDD